MEIFKRLLILAKPHIPKFIIAALCMLFVGATTAILAALVKPVLDDIFIKRDATMLKLIPIAVIVIYFIKMICSYGQTVIMNFIGQRVVTDLRNDLYNHIQQQSLSFFTKNPTGILMSRITNDVNMIQGAVSEAVTSLCKDSFSIIGLAPDNLSYRQVRDHDEEGGYPYSGNHGYADQPSSGDHIGNENRQGIRDGGV